MTPNTPAGGAVALLPCPFCGCNDISEGEVLCESPRGKFTKQNMCRKCGALGPEARVDGPDYGDVAANAAWNRPRATVPLDAVREISARLLGKTSSLHRMFCDELEALTRGDGNG